MKSEFEKITTVMTLATPLRILHLFPQSMGLYGDRGNAIALLRRCALRGIPARLDTTESVESLSFGEIDIVIIGGGADKDQQRVASRLAAIDKKAFEDAIEEGLVVLAVCGGYQFLGLRYTTASGETIPGLGIFPAVTESGHGRRLIGNVEVVASRDIGGRLVGFENHGGRTWILGREASPLGFVRYGQGNNGVDGTEGCRVRNCFGTYLHGPVLPNNPSFADALVSLALSRRSNKFLRLAPLEDSVEEAARYRFLQRCKSSKRIASRLGLEF